MFGGDCRGIRGRCPARAPQTAPVVSRAKQRPHAKIRRLRRPRAGRSTFTPSQDHRNAPMDIERVNAIGTTLADLSARTEALRGYL